MCAATASTSAFCLPAMVAMAAVGLNQNLTAWLIGGVITALVFLASVLRIRLEVSEAGLRVVNLWKSYAVPWGDVSHVDSAWAWLGGAFILSPFNALRIRTKDGRKIVVQASLGNPGKVAELVLANTRGSAASEFRGVLEAS
jgi:hypothetical protein